MSETMTSTDRRSFLKTGALAAAPLAVVTPAVALADDGSKARLARLEDERAIEALQRQLLRHLNGAGDGAQLIASSDAIELGTGLRAIAEDMRHESHLALAEDGLAATTRCCCCLEREVAFTGDTTLERMARFQGQGSHRFEEQRTLAVDYAKDKDGWKIIRARLA
jgi:hypothetical protein